MKITLQIDAPIEEAEAIKELLAYKIEGVGVVRILKIEDDGFGQQQFWKGEK